MVGGSLSLFLVPRAKTVIPEQANPISPVLRILWGGTAYPADGSAEQTVLKGKATGQRQAEFPFKPASKPLLHLFLICIPCPSRQRDHWFFILDPHTKGPDRTSKRNSARVLLPECSHILAQVSAGRPERVPRRCPVFFSHPGTDACAPTSGSSGPSSLNNPVPTIRTWAESVWSDLFCTTGTCGKSQPGAIPHPHPRGCRKKEECPKSTCHRGTESHAGWYK